MSRDEIKVHMHNDKKGRAHCMARTTAYQKPKSTSDATKVTCKRCLAILYMKSLGDMQ